MKGKTAPSALCERTLYLVRNRHRDTTYDDIAEATGLTTAWIGNFARGRMDHPSVVFVEALYVHLTGEALDLGPQ